MTESAFSVSPVSTNSAIWNWISGGISSKPIATILWIVTDCGLVQHSTRTLEWIKRIQYPRQPRNKSTKQAIVRRVDLEATVLSRLYSLRILVSIHDCRTGDVNHIAAPSQNRLYLSFFLSKLCENRRDRGATSSFTASEGTFYALTHALTHSFLLTIHSFAGPPRVTPALRTNALPPTYRLVTPSPRLLSCILLYNVRFPIPYPLSSARQSHHFPPRNLPKNTRKPQSHSLQAFSEDSGPWLCSIPWCLCIEREAAIRTGAAFGFWSRVCRVIFNPVVVMQH